jgi:acetoin utilization deacetylase AcuC-like enzyme
MKRMVKQSLVQIYHSKSHQAHAWIEPHPENPLRVENIIKVLMPSIKSGNAILHSFRDCKGLGEGRAWMLEDGDTYVTDSTSDVLLVTKEMISAAAKDLVDCSFVMCRPPGHHASVAPSGFCHENNAWFAATELTKKGLKNICIFDMDAHHGDGTEACVRLGRHEYEGVRFVSTHAFGKGIYPGTGDACSEKRILNLPLSRRTGPYIYLKVLQNDVIPFIGKPDVLIVSAGYDTHIEDPMKLMNLKTHTYGQIGKALKNIGVPILFLLEGGYNTSVLGDCVKETLTPWFQNDV